MSELLGPCHQSQLTKVSCACVLASWMRDRDPGSWLVPDHITPIIFTADHRWNGQIDKNLSGLPSHSSLLLSHFKTCMGRWVGNVFSGPCTTTFNPCYYYNWQPAIVTFNLSSHKLSSCSSSSIRASNGSRRFHNHGEGPERKFLD